MELQESSDDTAVYCPQVKADHIAKKNQEFQTLEDVKLFYTSYAQEGGFNIRSWTSRKKDGVVVRMEYVCTKEGTSQITGKKRGHNKTREGCKARQAKGKQFRRPLISLTDVKVLGAGVVSTVHRRRHGQTQRHPKLVSGRASTPSLQHD